jgi:hypothetical protein
LFKESLQMLKFSICEYHFVSKRACMTSPFFIKLILGSHRTVLWARCLLLLVEYTLWWTFRELVERLYCFYILYLDSHTHKVYMKFASALDLDYLRIKCILIKFFNSKIVHFVFVLQANFIEIFTYIMYLNLTSQRMAILHITHLLRNK